MDPLEGVSLPSLFPRTFRDSSNELKSRLLEDLESIHDFMKSRTLRSPSKFSEQAKAVIDGNSVLPSSYFDSILTLANKDQEGAAKVKENPQERRPALGRKRARFSLKPSSSYPAVSLEASLDIDLLQDPAEYFLAHEKFENAKKELQRQRGENVNGLNYLDLSNQRRCRRPGILGKSVSYNYHYSSTAAANNDTFIPSKATLGPGIFGSPSHSLEPRTADPNLGLQKDLTGSVTKSEKRVNEIFDELLSDRCEDLDEDGTVSFLQEHLHIKPLNPGKLSLPDFREVGKTDLLDMGKKFPKPPSTQSDVQNLVKRISIRTPVKHKMVTDSSVHSVDSATPPKSPFPSVSALKKRILQSNDPFSALNRSPARDSSLKHLGEQSNLVDTREVLRASENLELQITEIGGDRVDGWGLKEMTTRDPILSLQNPLNNDASDSTHNKRNMNVDVVVMDDSESRRDTDLEADGAKERKENVGDMQQEGLSSGQLDINSQDSCRFCTDFPVDGSHEMEIENMSQNAQPSVRIEDPTAELESNQDQPDQSSNKAARDQTKEPSRESPKKCKSKKPPCTGSKRRTLSHRQSLAGAGTYWESGVRRSNRIRIRPLEYWKGERFLYGRVHESLTTVIGLKYASPAKGNGKPNFRVKSYVSDEYKELVEIAALH